MNQNHFPKKVNFKQSIEESELVMDYVLFVIVPA